jgi:hypothetical protein
MAPQTRRVLVISLAGHPALPGFMQTIAGLQSSSGVAATPAGVRDAVEVERNLGLLIGAKQTSCNLTANRRCSAMTPS